MLAICKARPASHLASPLPAQPLHFLTADALAAACPLACLQTDFKQPIYAVEVAAHPSFSGGKVHQPKGAWSNPERLTWRKYQSWEPSS
jgi:hypothetical protein